MLSRRHLLWSAVAVVVLMAVGAVAPRWLLFLVAMAASHGLAILGVVVLNRGGGATFGQGLSASDVAAMRADKRLQVAVYPGLGYGAIGFNLANGPRSRTQFGQNALVRKAFELPPHLLGDLAAEGEKLAHALRDTKQAVEDCCAAAWKVWSQLYEDEAKKGGDDGGA